MNNKEKARQLAIQSTKDVDDNGNEVYNAFVEAALLEMAQWKDEQFKQILQVIYSKTLSIEKDAVIEQVYKTLFDEGLDRSEFEKDELKNLLEKIKNIIKNIELCTKNTK